MGGSEVRQLNFKEKMKDTYIVGGFHVGPSVEKESDDFQVPTVRSAPERVPSSLQFNSVQFKSCNESEEFSQPTQ